MHGYVPYHTKEYLARQALDRKERVVQGASKAASNSKSRLQQVASAVPGDLLNASSASAPPPAPKLSEVAYHDHDDPWNLKMPVDITHLYPQAKSETVRSISLPIETWPGYGTPNAIQHFPSAAQSPPSLIPPDFTIDYYSDFAHGPQQLYPMQSQEQGIGESLTVGHGMPPYNGNGPWNWLPQPQ